MPRPNDRPSIEDVLHRLDIVSNPSEPPSSGVVEEMEVDGDDWDSTGSSGVPNWTRSTMVTEEGTAISSGSSYLVDRSPSPMSVSIESESPVVEATGGVDVRGSAYEVARPHLWSSQSYQVSVTQPYKPDSRITRCIEPSHDP